MIDTFHSALNTNRNVSYSYWVYKVDDIPIGQGADGFLIGLSHLKNFKKYYDFFIKENFLWFYQDDIMISTFLYNKNINIQCMRQYLREQDEYIYTFGSGHEIHGINRMKGELSRKNLRKVLISSFMKFYPKNLRKFR